MSGNRLKEKLQAGERALGLFSIINSPAFYETLGYAGLDFVIIDAEHGPFSMESAEGLVRAAEFSGLTPLIRVRGNDPSLILRALDIGAHGIQIPHVSTREEALKAVRAAKYFPLGHRGLSPFTRAGRYGLDPLGHAARANEKTMVVLNIEGIEGLRNLEEILEVEGIDVIFLGPYDLSQSLGKPGRVEDPEVIAAIRSGAEMSRARGIACGSFAKDMNYMEMLIKAGIQYLTYSVDSEVLLSTFRSLKESFSQLCKSLNNCL